MFCKKCGKELKDGSRYCMYCGARLSYDGDAAASPKGGRNKDNAAAAPKGGRNKDGKAGAKKEHGSRKPGRAIIILLLVLLLIGAGIAGAVFLRLPGPAGGENLLTEEQSRDAGTFLCTLCLSADDTNFYLGEEAVPQFTLAAPKDISGTITVSDEEGETVFEVDSDAMELNERSMRTASFSLRQDTSYDHIKEYTAAAGENYSSPLSIYITPVITEEMVGDSIDIALQAHDFVDGGDPGRTTEEKAAAALEWLEKDERVAAAEIMEDGKNVYFVTNDNVGAVYQTEPDNEWAKNNYAGFDEGDSESLAEETPLADLFSENGTDIIDENDPVLFQETSGSMVSTDPDVLLLMPCPDAMDAGVCESLRADTRVLANAFDNSEPTILENDNAAYAIIQKRLNEYGFITFFTHGGTQGSDKKNGNYTRYLLCEMKFTENDKQDTVQRMKDKLKTYAYGGYYGDDEGKEDFKDFYSAFYSEKEKINNNKKPLLFLSTTGNECKLLMTGQYLIDRYQDQYFDNAIFFFVNCHGLEYRTLDEFLISHGCRYVLGFLDHVRMTDAKRYYSNLAARLTDFAETHIDHTKEMQEVFDKIEELPEHWIFYIEVYAVMQTLEDRLVRSRDTGSPPDWSKGDTEIKQYIREKIQRVYGNDWENNAWEFYTKDGDTYVKTGKTFTQEIQDVTYDSAQWEELLRNTAFDCVNDHLQESGRSNADIQNLLQAWKNTITLQYFENNRERTIGELLRETAAAQVPAAEAAIESALPEANRQETLLEALIAYIQGEEYERWISRYFDQEEQKWLLWYIDPPTSIESYNKDAIPADAKDTTLYYLTGDNPVFALKGSGTFTGTVVVQDVNEEEKPVGEPLPAAGAEVTAYLLSNQAYTEVGRAKADDQGVFLFEDLPNGHLIMQAELDGSASAPCSTYFVEGKSRAWQGGEIRISHTVKEKTLQVLVWAEEENMDRTLDDGTVVFTGSCWPIQVFIPDFGEGERIIQQEIKATIDGFRETANRVKEDASTDFDSNYAPSVCDSPLDDAFVSGRALSFSWLPLSYYNKAAHGAYDSVQKNYDAVTGRALSLGELLKEGADFSMLKDLWRSRLADLDSLHYGPDECLSMIELSEDMKSGWYFSKGGLTLVFPQGMISSYGALTIKVPIPYNDLKEIIKEEYLPADGPEETGNVSIINREERPQSGIRRQFGFQEESKCLYAVSPADHVCVYAVKEAAENRTELKYLTLYINHMSSSDLVYLKELPQGWHYEVE